jgi:uncharacterized protein (DUF433 family)
MSSPPYHDLDFLAGTWTEQDSREFFANLADLSQIDDDFPELTSADVLACLAYAADKERRIAVVYGTEYETEAVV